MNQGRGSVERGKKNGNGLRADKSWNEGQETWGEVGGGWRGQEVLKVQHCKEGGI